MKAVIQSVLARFGCRLVRLSSLGEPPLRRFFQSLVRFGFSPKHIIDVGANRGTWTRTAVTYFPHCHYTLIEPQAQLKVYVEDLIRAGHRVRWLSAGASDRPGELLLTVADRDDSSSFIPQELGPRAIQVAVPVLTLNDVLSQSDAPFPDLVKIDAEGYDLKVLDGATSLIGRTDIFLVEAAVRAPVFENTVCRVVGRMSDCGYDLMDITDLNRSRRHDLLWLCELAFLRRGRHLLDAATTFD
jgi:FkbM family methyltransferase